MKKILWVILVFFTFNMPVSANGQNKVNGWYQNEGEWYFNDYLTGERKTGWIASGENWYYCDLFTGIMQKGFVEIDGKIYFFSDTGMMQTGNKTIDGIHYQFNENGELTGYMNKGRKLYSGYCGLDQEIREVLNGIIKEGMSEREELKAIHDWIVLNFRYGGIGKNDFDLGAIEEGLNPNVKTAGILNKSKENYRWAYKALVKRKGVCDDYAQVFNVLADALGYRTCIMPGKYDGKGHSVSLVWFDGEWMIVDCQLDDSTKHMLDIVFLKHNDEIGLFESEMKYFDWNNPKDVFVQSTEYWWDKNPIYQEYETIEEWFDDYRQIEFEKKI